MNINRRHFLRANTLLLMRWLVDSFWPRLPFLPKPPSPSKVGVLKITSYETDLFQVFLEFIPKLTIPEVKNKVVLLKPNLVEFEETRPIHTHPEVIRGAIKLFKYLGAKEVVVAEGPGHRRDTDYLIKASGWKAVCEEERVIFVDLNTDNLLRTRLKSNLSGLGELYLPETVLKADVVISLPKMKTHHWVGVTLSLKNMFGIVPGIKYGWPKNILHWKDINKCIIDVNSTIRPEFAIVDGIMAMEGDGPIQGNNIPANVVVMGDDLVAVDATCCRIMGINPRKIKYLKLAHKNLGRMGESSIKYIGTNPHEIKRDFRVLKQFKFIKERDFWRLLLE